ncbi:AB-hydrolase YheT, partial [Trametes meyenii]
LVFCAVLCAVYLVWKNVRGRRTPFVTLHSAPESAVLPQNDKRNAASARSFIQIVDEKVPSLGPKAKYDGFWWLPGGDAQTMYSSIADFSKVDPVVYERKLLRLPDQGIVAVDISPPLESRPISPAEDVLLVAHGLTGGSHEAYVRAVLAKVIPAKDARGLGLRAVVLNYRGCNGTPVATPKLYHAGSSDDVRHVVLWICRTFPQCRIYGLGWFSLGGNILTKYAAEEGDDCPLQALVTLANPWNFVSGCYHLPSTFLGRFVYRYVLGGALRRLLQLHHRVFLHAASLPVGISRARIEEILKWRRITLGQYDELVTAPLYGFRDALDYYEQISSARVVRDVRIPCLAINSIDGPITGKGCLPIHEVQENPWIVLAVTRTGGHLGWYERSPDGGRVARWYVKPVTQFLAALLEYGLEERAHPRTVVDQDGFIRQAGREDVGFAELSHTDIQGRADLIVSGLQTSKLFSGW